MMKENQELIYDGEQERVDVWLTKRFPYSRNFFHHIISRGGILINGKVAKKSSKLKSGDIIKIDDLERYLSPILLKEAPKIEIPIIIEEEDYLVINKPKGVLSHPNSIWDVGKPSVVGFLYHHYKNLPSIGNFIRAGLLHRLDKDTDGLMIIAKTEKGLAYFKTLFMEKSSKVEVDDKSKIPLKKRYRAKCEITMKGKNFIDEIKNKLPYLIKEVVVPKVPNPTSKMGITQIESMHMHQEKNEVDLILQIFTGRTHQIRYHLSNHGLPILGDYLYGKESDNPMQLTAFRLEFKDLNGKDIRVEI